MSLDKRPKLKIDWATHEAAKYACKNFHYTKKIPVNKLVKIGAWENDKFIGVLIFGMGASAQLHKQFHLKNTEVCELVRVALSRHKTPVSRIMSIAVKFLRNKCPELRLIVSFADPTQGHHGGIYQASNWIFTGKSANTVEYFYNNDWRHVTDVYKRLSSEKIKTLPKREKSGKFRYVLCLDESLLETIEKDRKPYPKRVRSVEFGTSSYQEEGDGESPIRTLQNQ